MPATNKYNIRAIRKDLDDYVRSASWNSFRSKFRTIEKDADLCQAIVEYRPKSSRHKHGSLLHSLCRSADAHPPPADVVQFVISAVPRALHIRDAPGHRTPLHVAVKRGTPPGIVECLLRNDAARLTVAERDRNGDTPALLAVRSGNPDAEDMIGLILKYDAGGRSLLMGSRKRNRTPLWYVAAQELRTANGREVSEELRFVLFRTYEALIGRGAETATERDMKSSGDSNYCNDGSSPRDENEAGAACLLEATIACSHLLGKCAPKLLEIILKNDLYDGYRLFKPDSEGNLTLHIACMAAFRLFEKNLSLNGNGERVNLIHHLLRLNPQASKQCNARGELPLHLAIQTDKDWEHIDSLLCAHPESVRLGNRNKELPLHLAIKFGRDIAITKELWKRYPESATFVDCSTGLYPFQLVACYNERATEVLENHSNICQKDESGAPHNKNESEADRIDIIYFFLREYPQIINRF